MMIPVEEHQVPFSNNQEECVSQFDKFGHLESKDPKARDSICVSDTNGRMEPVFGDCLANFLKCSKSSTDGKDSQRCIPEEEKVLGLKWFAILHQLFPIINHQKVKGNSNDWKKGSVKAPFVVNSKIIGTFEVEMAEIVVAVIPDRIR